MFHLYLGFMSIHLKNDSIMLKLKHLFKNDKLQWGKNKIIQLANEQESFENVNFKISNAYKTFSIFYKIVCKTHLQLKTTISKRITFS